MQQQTHLQRNSVCTRHHSFGRHHGGRQQRQITRTHHVPSNRDNLLDVVTYLLIYRASLYGV